MAVAESGQDVKTVVAQLHEYLSTNLDIDGEFLGKLLQRNLLSNYDRPRLMATMETEGRRSAVFQLLDYMRNYYDGNALERFCRLLEESGKISLRESAKKIEEELVRFRHIHMSVSDQHGSDAYPSHSTRLPPDNQPRPTCSSQEENSSHTSENHGKHASTVSSTDRQSKIKSIVDMYRCGNKILCLPANPDLEDEFDTVLGMLSSLIHTAPPECIYMTCTRVRIKYRRYMFGVRVAPLPHIPETSSGLLNFVAENSSPYEILLVQTAVDCLASKEMNETFHEYKEKLAAVLNTKLLDCKRRGVVLPKFKDRTHMAVVLSSEHVLLALVLHLKEYLIKLLGLEEALFEGFAEGCIILFFAIPKVDATQLSTKIFSCESDLKKIFGATHVIAFDYFAYDLESSSFQQLNVNQKVKYGPAISMDGRPTELQLLA